MLIMCLKDITLKTLVDSEDEAKPTANNGNNVMNIDNLSSEKQTALKDLVKQLHDFEDVDPDTFMNHLDK